MTMPKTTFYDWSFSIRLAIYALIIKLDLLFMLFLVAYATCSHIRLVIECHFLHNEGHTNTYICTMNNYRWVFWIYVLHYT